MEITDIVANIDRRLGELDIELRQLSQARAELLNGAASKARRQPRQARKRARPTFAVVSAGKLIELLISTPGVTTKELARAANGDPSQVLTLLKEQGERGEVRRSGARAGTRWHAITDEDRRAARAAEIRASSRKVRARRT